MLSTINETMLSTIDDLRKRSRRAISDTHPTVQRGLSRAVRYYATARVRQASVLAGLRYDAPIEPERLYDVDPHEIERTVSWTEISVDRKRDEHPKFRRPKYRLAGRVFDGDWDTVDRQFVDSTIYRSFEQRFGCGVPWEATDFYTETLGAIDAGERPWDCQSRLDLEQRCEELDALYERIATDGYLTQQELHDRGTADTSPHRIYRNIWSEIGVHVGRNGEFIFQDGRNRLAMARILDLDSVPVVILVRHVNWQRKRDRVARGALERSELPERLQTHPDLVGLF